MPAFIHQISTHVPEFLYSQVYARDCMKGWTADPKTKRLIHAIYNRSGIETRHSVCGDWKEDREATLFKTGPDGMLISPGTGERNACYAEGSRKLAVELARKTLEEAVGFKKEDITHIIFASCTGFANPGPDYHIIRELGLSENVQRYTLGFMGCYAAFPGLRMAAQFCEANPAAVVMVVCLELCSLHVQISEQPDNILANSLFADGAAAVIVSARQPAPERPAYQLQSFRSSLLIAGEQDMAWDIGNHGFNIALSSYVPDIIGANVRALLEDTLGREGLELNDITEWAIHPGGRSILDKVEKSLDLSRDALVHSRNVLRNYGNMSCPTILFVLKEMMETSETTEALTFAMAFGPGLTVETAVLNRFQGSKVQGSKVLD